MNDFFRQSVHEAIDLDYQVVPMRGKRPILRNWQETPMGKRDIDRLIAWYQLTAYGILLGSPVCVLDKDGRSRETSDFLKEHGAKSPMEVLTKRGVHSYFSIPKELEVKTSKIKWRNLGLDVKLTGAVVGRGSEVEGFTRRLKAGKRMVPVGELPPLPSSLVSLLNETQTKVQVTVAEVRFESRSQIRNPRAYALRIESHQGANGSSGLVRAVCVCRDAGMSSQETLEFLVSEWNREPRVTPPWPEEEIVRCSIRMYQQAVR